MTIVRIGNNIHVLWKIYNNNGSKYALSGKVRRLWLSSAALEKEIETYAFQNRNELTFMVDAGDLTRYGAYKLVLQIRESESETEDATYDLSQVFQIVSSSYPDAIGALTGEVDVEFESVLNNVVVERIEGLSAYEVALNNGFEGTEQEWLDSLVGGGHAQVEGDVAFIGKHFGEGDIPDLDFNPYYDTVWTKSQNLSEAQKAQVLANLGINAENLVYQDDDVIMDGGTSNDQ